jgi:uncharacterized Zn finger protein
VTRDSCPRCSSDRIAPIATRWHDPGGDELTADVAPPSGDPPNMRCEKCGHVWWLAPRAAKIDPDQDGVAG